MNQEKIKQRLLEMGWKDKIANLNMVQRDINILIKESQKEMAMELLTNNIFHKLDYLSINKKDLNKYL